MEKNSIIIALVGKGGVGKTSLSALTVRLLSETYPNKRILAIDADPAVGLSTALGVEVGFTVDDIRRDFIKSVEDGVTKAAVELLGEARCRIVDALVERENISFLAIGRPESAGCYCKVNAYLKEVIGAIADNYDYVVIDGEAGIEQINRRVMERVTHLILVSDASKKGQQVAQTIHQVAKELVMFEKTGVIINRMPDLSLQNLLQIRGLPLLACIPDDREMSVGDMMGNHVFGLPRDAAILAGAGEALIKLGIL